VVLKHTVETPLAKDLLLILDEVSLFMKNQSTILEIK